MALPPPEACCEELLDALLLDVLSLLDAVLDALPVDALLEALPDALPPLPEPPPQAERTDAPTTLTPMAPPSRINCPREIFSFKIIPSLSIVVTLCHTALYAGLGITVVSTCRPGLAYTYNSGTQRQRGALR